MNLRNGFWEFPLIHIKSMRCQNKPGMWAFCLVVWVVEAPNQIILEETWYAIGIFHKQILSLGIQKVWALWVESQTIGWNLVDVSQTNLGRVNGSHGTIHAGWITRSPSWLVWCFCFAFVCLVMFPWSLGHLGGIGCFALLELEDAQKIPDLNLSYLYTYVCKVLAGMVVPIHVHEKCMIIYISQYPFKNPSPYEDILLIVSEFFWDCARRWTRCRCWSWRLIASFDLRSAIRRGKNHLKAVIFCDFVGVYLYDIYEIQKK